MQITQEGLEKEDEKVAVRQLIPVWLIIFGPEDKWEVDY